MGLSTLTTYSSWLLLALKILFTISPSSVNKINPSLGLSSLPIGKFFYDSLQNQ